MSRKQRYTIEEKQKVVQYHIEHQKQHPGWTLRQTASAFSMTHQTIKNWVDKYQDIGLERLVDRRTREFQKSAAIGEDARLIALQKQNRKLIRDLKKSKEREIMLKNLYAYFSQND